MFTEPNAAVLEAPLIVVAAPHAVPAHERMEIVGKLVPTANSPSNLPRAPQFLRICPYCEQLVGRDLSDCPYCGRRLPALERRS